MGDQSSIADLQAMRSRAVATNMRRLRKARGWSAEQLAEALTAIGFHGLNRNVIAGLESRPRVRPISVDELIALATVFEVDPMLLTVPHDPIAAARAMVAQREQQLAAAREALQSVLS